MTTDTKALITEAEKYAEAPWTSLDLITARAWLKVLIAHHRRLAAALEEATPLEGWRVAGYHNEHGAMVNEDTAGTWWITKADGLTGTAKDGTCEFTTARAAMEALEDDG